MQWYYAKFGKQEGPVELEALQGLLRSGQLAPTDLVWREGMAEWTAAKDVPEVNPAEASSQGAAFPPVEGTPPQGVTAAPQVMAAAPLPPGQRVPNYLVPAILVTVLCCLPFGVPAIVYAAKVDGLVSQGDIAGAIEASNKAKMWSWIAAGSGLTFAVLYTIVIVVAAAGSRVA